MPMRAPESVVAISLSLRVGTPEASAASSSSRMVAKPEPSFEGSDGGDAEIHVAAIAAQDVPGGPEHDELQHRVAGEEIIVIAEQAHETEQHRHRADRDREEDG